MKPPLISLGTMNTALACAHQLRGVAERLVVPQVGQHLAGAVDRDLLAGLRLGDDRRGQHGGRKQGRAAQKFRACNIFGSSLAMRNNAAACRLHISFREADSRAGLMTTA